MKNTNRKIVSYTRFSTDMQRDDSCADQQRNITEYCRKNGIDTDHLVNLSDKGESGTDTSRPGFTQLRSMIDGGEIGVLLVDDLSRLTRGQDLQALITDIRFQGGRLIAVTDGYDSSNEGTDLIAGVKGIMNSNYIAQLGKQVRRGQRGRVEDDGSAGDAPYGYQSCLCDPTVIWDGRGAKPKKKIVIDESESIWVGYVFERYAEDGVSIAKITKELNDKRVPKGHRSSRPGWHSEIVRRMLENKKYIGQWSWGATMTVRSSTGKKRQIPVEEGQIVHRDRPELRIIPQELWDKAQARRLAVKQLYTGGKKPNPRSIYPTRLLSGLVRCGHCGGSMIVEHGPAGVFYGCTGHRQGRGCDAVTRCPAEKAETALIRRLVDILTGSPEWLNRVIANTHEAFVAAIKTVPLELKKVDDDIEAITKRISRLLDMAESGEASPSLRDRLREQENRLEELQRTRHQLDDAKGCCDVPPPDDTWIREKLKDLAAQLQLRGPQVNQLIRPLVSVRYRVDVTPGKRRGRPRLEVTLKIPELIRMACGQWSQVLGDVAARLPGDSMAADVIHVPIGEPSRMDRLLPEIVRMRDAGASWNRIGEALGIRGGNACTAYERYKRAVSREVPGKAA